MEHIVDQLAQSIREAGARQQPLRIRGGGSKDFYGGDLRGEVLDMTAYTGIVDYDPTELVITARAGTSLAQIESLMHDRGQILAFEPPHYTSGGTLGGAIACGLSGPRRPYAGSARDLVLGVRMLDGKGTDLRFGGQVMKNVAGYDVSRLMSGSLGTLGVLLEISLKALPRPQSEMTLRLEQNAAEAIDLMNAWAGKPLPITATCLMDGVLYVRLSGADAAVNAARAQIGGEALTAGDAFWRSVRDQSADFFNTIEPLWRVSMKSTTPPNVLPEPQVIEWSGALRWIAGSHDAAAIRETARRAGGHATLFRGGDKRAGVFQPLSPALLKLHRRLKGTFDPNRILNPGRMYPDF